MNGYSSLHDDFASSTTGEYRSSIINGNSGYTNSAYVNTSSQAQNKTITTQSSPQNNINQKISQPISKVSSSHLQVQALLKHYEGTGELPIAALYCVGQMAIEGTIFLPNRADKLLEELRWMWLDVGDAKTNLSKAVQNFLDNSEYKLNQRQDLDTVITMIGALDCSVGKFIGFFEHEMISVISIAFPPASKLNTKYIEVIQFVKSFIFERSIEEISRSQKGGHRVLKYLNELQTSADCITKTAQKSIIARTPLYQLIRGNLNESI